MLASLILRTSSSYSFLSPSASRLIAWYSNDRAFIASNSALVSLTALPNIASRLVASAVLHFHAMSDVLLRVPATAAGSRRSPSGRFAVLGMIGPEMRLHLRELLPLRIQLLR